MKKPMDYSILWKYFNDSLNAGEEKLLREWLSADQKHRDYFERLKQKHLIEGAHQNIISSSNAWKKIKITPKPKKSYRWHIGIAAGIVLIVAAYMGFVTLNQPTPEIVTIEDITFEPGANKATLVLNSGEKLELESERDTTINAAQAVISNTQSKLNYTAPAQPTLKNKRKRNKEQEYNTLIVPRGGEYDLVLSDGTQIKVNSESILKYPVVFDARHRSIELIGEAFFNVATDSLRPFIVTSGQHRIKVYGTAFNVKSYKNENYTSTTLVEGKVSVSLNEDDASEELLEPGHQSVFNKSTHNFEQRKVNIKAYTAWQEGRFYFRDMPLEEMTRTLGRWYDVEFEFKNEKVKGLTFNGNLKRYENIQTILNQLVKTNEITFTAYDNTIYVE